MSKSSEAMVLCLFFFLGRVKLAGVFSLENMKLLLDCDKISSIASSSNFCCSYLILFSADCNNFDYGGALCYTNLGL